MEGIIKKIIVVICILILFSSCSIKQEILLSESKSVVFKTKNLSFNDTGFLKKGKNYINLQVFSSAILVLNLEIYGEYVCLQEGCLKKREFIDRYLNQNYPENILENILEKKPIFDGDNLVLNKNGFEQKIVKENLYNIIYTIDENEIKFIDKLNKFIIKLKNI